MEIIDFDLYAGSTYAITIADDEGNEVGIMAEFSKGDDGDLISISASPFNDNDVIDLINEYMKRNQFI